MTARDAVRLPLRAVVALTPWIVLTGCNRHQSAFAPFGSEAASTLRLTWLLTIGAAVICGIVAALVIAAVRAPEGRMGMRGGLRLVMWAGAVIPTLVLLGVLLTALPAMRPIPTTPADLRIEVTGEQFWWRVRYLAPGAAPVETANALHLPIGRTVEIALKGGDVVHSFWVPGLAGKMDMIPGRTNRLVVRADRAGVFRGQCTEFCGLSHALMAFDVEAMPPAAFDRWLAAERVLAAPAGRGAALFAHYGCAGCHAIRRDGATPGAGGTTGTIGPDLTHFGARRSVAAGTLPMTDRAVADFIRHPVKTKPGVRMPAFPHMPDADALAIARMLRGLQ